MAGHFAIAAAAEALRWHAVAADQRSGRRRHQSDRGQRELYAGGNRRREPLGGGRRASAGARAQLFRGGNPAGCGQRFRHIVGIGQSGRWKRRRQRRAFHLCPAADASIPCSRNCGQLVVLPVQRYQRPCGRQHDHLYSCKAGGRRSGVQLVARARGRGGADRAADRQH